MRSRMATAVLANFFGFFFRDPRAQESVIAHLHLDGGGRFGDNIERFLLRFSEKRIEECSFADVVAQFAMFEKDMHSFPERVVENLNEFLVDERVFRSGGGEIGAFDSGKSKGHRVALARKLKRVPDFGIALGRTETHDHVVGLHKRLEPGFKGEGQIKRWERAFSDDHRVHEFDRNVLGVGRIRSTSESQKASAAKKALGHFAASFRQAAASRAKNDSSTSLRASKRCSICAVRSAGAKVVA